MKSKWGYLSALCAAVVALIVGASFHGYRIHPENVENYNLGVTMGITMAIVSAVCFILFVVLFVFYKKRNKR